MFSQILPAGDTKSLKDLLDDGMISVNEIQVEVGLNLFLDPNTAIKHVLTISFSSFIQSSSISSSSIRLLLYRH